MAYDASKEKRTQLKSFQKNGHGDFIVINAVEVDGRNPSIDIRTMYTDDNEELRPTTKGLRFSTTIIPELAAMYIQDMDDEQLSELAARVNLMPLDMTPDELEKKIKDTNSSNCDEEVPEFAPAVKQKNESVHLKAFKKNNRGDYIVVSRIDSEGYETNTDIRTMYTDSDGKLRPTTKGVRFGISHILDLVEGLVKGLTDDELAELAAKCQNILDFYKEVFD